MDCRERILAVFNHELPDRVPIAELDINSKIIAQHYGDDYGGIVDMSKLKWMSNLPGWRNLLRSTMKSPQTYIDIYRRAVKLYRHMGLDAVFTYTALFPNKNLGRKPKIGGKPAIQFTIPHWASYIDEFGRYLRILPTPYGVESNFYVDGALTSEELYNEWGFQAESAHDPVRMEIYKTAVKDSKNPDGSYSVYPIPALPGLFEMVWQPLGFKFFSKCLRTNKKFLTRVLDERLKFMIEIIKDLANNGAEMVLFGDDYGFKEGPMLNPISFKEFIVPRLKELVVCAHMHNMKFLFHSCGNINAIWQDILSTGIDGIHPLDPSAGMNIFYLKKQHPKLVFVGNVSIQDLQDKTPEDIRAYTTRLMTECKPNGHYILSSAHTLSPSIKLENYLEMRAVHAKLAPY